MIGNRARRAKVVWALSATCTRDHNDEPKRCASTRLVKKQMQAWRSAHPHASYAQYIASTMPENVTIGADGKTIEWLDERLCVGRVRDMWISLCNACGPSSAWLGQ